MESFIKQKAIEIGFDLVGISPASQFSEHQALKTWLHAWMHGTIEWFERGLEKRLDPLKVMPEAKSVIVCAKNYNSPLPYSTECKETGRGWISRYAWGEDYHLKMEKMLHELIRSLSKHFNVTGPAVCGVPALPLMAGDPPGSTSDVTRFMEFRKKSDVQNVKWKIYVDTGPNMERVFAKHAGIGWVGKNTCLIHPKMGSFLFLGVILTDLYLKPDTPQTDHCGTCTRCIDACPTEAITEPYKLDARKCISYLTIEHRGPIEPMLAERMGNHLYGCDICQDVCPWNRKSPRTEDPAFQPRDGCFNPHLETFQKKLEQEYPKGFTRSPLKRAKKEGLLRNIAMVMKNRI